MIDQAYVDGGDRVVYKYPLEDIVGPVALRAGAKAVLVDVVDGVPTLWVEQPAVALSAAEEVWTVRVVGTGIPFPARASREHLGSARCVTTGLVWHVYLELKETR